MRLFSKNLSDILIETSQNELSFNNLSWDDEFEEPEDINYLPSSEYKIRCKTDEELPSSIQFFYLEKKVENEWVVLASLGIMFNLYHHFSDGKSMVTPDLVDECWDYESSLESYKGLIENINDFLTYSINKEKYFDYICTLEIKELSHGIGAIEDFIANFISSEDLDCMVAISNQDLVARDFISYSRYSFDKKEGFWLHIPENF